jgi:hypothetical protein
MHGVKNVKKKGSDVVLIYCRRPTQIIHTVSIRMFITQRRHIGYLVNEKDEEGGTKYWIHPYFNRSGKLGSFITVREPDQSSGSFGLFYTERTGESFKFCAILKSQDFASHTNGVVPWTSHKFNSCFTSCLHKPAKHFKSPWGLRVLWRYVYVWATDATISSKACENHSRHTFRIARYLGT